MSVGLLCHVLHVPAGNLLPRHALDLRFLKPQYHTISRGAGCRKGRQARISGARHLFIGELPRELESLDRSRSHTVMCGSGARATIAASVLMRAGFTDVDLFLGSMGAWWQTGFDIESAG